MRSSKNEERLQVQNEVLKSNSTLTNFPSPLQWNWVLSLWLLIGSCRAFPSDPARNSSDLYLSSSATNVVQKRNDILLVALDLLRSPPRPPVWHKSGKREDFSQIVEEWAGSILNSSTVSRSSSRLNSTYRFGEYLNQFPSRAFPEPSVWWMGLEVMDVLMGIVAEPEPFDVTGLSSLTEMEFPLLHESNSSIWVI